MSLSTDQVRHVAQLARLSLTEEEVVLYANQLSRILEYMTVLNELDTSDVEATAQVTGLQNVQREDAISAYTARDELLECTKLPIQDHQIRVHPVF